jgi:hypothetical protein
MNRDPAMSVIIVTPDSYQVIRKTMLHLRAQTARERLEIVIVCPSRDQLGLLESDLEGFQRWKVVEVGEIKVLSAAKAAALPETSAPIVAFAEDHCFPEPGWAEALIIAHGQGHAAVGPIMRNANPATSISWAGLFLHYGCCMRPLLSGGCVNLPWHNTSYKRQVLLDYGSDLHAMLLVEGLLFEDLRAKGHTLHLQASAHTHHVNISILSSWIAHAFLGGRVFGAQRALTNRWPRWKRWLYVAGSPLIPVIRLLRTVRAIRKAGEGAMVIRVLPSMLAGLLPHALGEAAGYAMGLGDDTTARYSYYEMKRFLHVAERDRELLTA